MTIERIDFETPIIISPIEEGIDGDDRLWEADVFNKGYEGQITRTVLSPGSYQIMPDYLEKRAPHLWRMDVEASGEGQVTSQLAGSNNKPGIRAIMPQHTPMFPVLVQNEEATHSVLPTIFTWRLGVSPKDNIVTVEKGYKWEDVFENLYTEVNEDWKQDIYPFEVPAQIGFEVLRLMLGKEQDDSGLMGEKIEGSEVVIDKLKSAISEEFLENAVPGMEIGKNPELAELQFNYSDLEVLGKSILTIPTGKELIDAGFDPEVADTIALIRMICLGYYFTFDALFESAGGEATQELVMKAYNEIYQSK